MTNSEDHFTITYILLPENPVILTAKDLQVEAYKGEEGLIEYTLTNPMAFRLLLIALLTVRNTSNQRRFGII